MAIEDAAMLARCASNDADLSIAFRSYERLRFARTARVTTLSRYYGVIGQWAKPGLVWLRNMAFRITPSRAISNTYDPWSVSAKDR
jgi:2-polyprenyl-6-methoxyphenol hydroxylase-like FAD-dependent oxidoreductase